MENSPTPRWGHPLPKWSKHLKPRAIFWILLLVVLTAIGLFLAYLISEKKLEGATRFFNPKNVDVPLSGEYYFQTIQLLKKELDLDDVSVVSITLLRNQYAPPKITYTPILEFCSPNDSNWSYQVEVILGHDFMVQDQYIGKKISKEISNCKEQEINPPAIPGLTAIEIAQKLAKDNFEDIYDLWPYSLQAKRDQDKVLKWTIEFHKVNNEAKVLTLILDANTGELLDTIRN